ncbi:hypothetical protein L195_g033822 [Trifolium pratense]|uniref:Uncharacterized protein n=1 Tax=Trifolium pratense TaxID=57577 RepID=A0A2K3LH40_TRIPR|nr:hypothetical protein L195_g033822 [Trifolium pratense]
MRAICGAGHKEFFGHGVKVEVYFESVRHMSPVTRCLRQNQVMLHKFIWALAAPGHAQGVCNGYDMQFLTFFRLISRDQLERILRNKRMGLSAF